MKLRLAKASQLSWSWGLAWLSLAKSLAVGGWVGCGGYVVGGGPDQKIMPLCGSILPAETCQILSFAENPRWGRSGNSVDSL